MKFAAVKKPFAIRLLLFVLALFTIHYSLFTPSVRAQCTLADPTTATDQQIINQFNKCAISKNVYDDKIFNFNQIAGTVDSLNTQILGFSALHPQTNELAMHHSALASASNLVASLYAHPPASGVQYFAQEIQKFNPVQPAFAATGGTGFAALQPVQKLWSVFRNASYVGFVIVFVVMGFMIMFRAHISPQAVATVQDSIPRIVIALFLVTFSYAIAGLMIDIMFVLINVVINLLNQSGVVNGPQASEAIFGHSIFNIILTAWTDLFSTTADALYNIFKDVLNLGSVGNFIVFKIGVGGIGALIVGIAALFIMFRIFIMLLMAYVMIIILTLVAPFYFLIQALPGNNGAREWFKQMAAQIAIFPAVSFMVILAGVIAGIGTWGGTGAGELQNAGSEALKFPLLVGGLPVNAIGKIIGIGFLFMTPSAAELVKNAIGVKGGPQFGGAGAAALGAAGGFLGARARTSPLGRAFSDIGEAGAKTSTQKILNVLPGKVTARERLPH